MTKAPAKPISGRSGLVAFHIRLVRLGDGIQKQGLAQGRQRHRGVFQMKGNYAAVVEAAKRKGCEEIPPLPDLDAPQKKEGE